MAKTHVTMKVNGAEVEGLVEPRTLLVHFLRENLSLTGTTNTLSSTGTLTIAGTLASSATAGSISSGTISTTGDSITAGTLTVNANTTLSPASGVVINSGGATGTITGSGTVTQNGSSTLTVGGTNNYTGITFINSGKLTAITRENVSRLSPFLVLFLHPPPGRQDHVIS